MSRGVELSCDLGEACTDEERAVEAAIWPLVGAANVACGGHVGDEESMRAAIASCVEHGVTLGAHPSYPDREGFGRRHVEMPRAELVASLAGQLSALASLAKERQRRVERVKPHGALYNEAQRDPVLAGAVVDAVRLSLPGAAVVCAVGSQVERACHEAGLPVVREAFVDRRYASDGSLHPRGEAGALLTGTNEAAEQAVRLATSGRVVANDGTEVDVTFETLCAHSDMPGSVERIRAVRAALVAAGFEIRRS